MDTVTVKELQKRCKRLGIKGYNGKSKSDLVDMLFEYHKANKIEPKEFSKKTYKTIYHTADIHIRPLERHKEYADVFVRMMKMLHARGKEELDSSLLVICGDLFHHKTNITADMLLLTRNLFRKLSGLLDIIIIPGNHDAMTSASVSGKRVDTITGILDGASSNVYYLKNTGIYYSKNLVFAVDSFLDTRKIFYDSIPISILTGRKVICLYHGIVQGCGVPSEGEPKSLEDFDRFDMVLLGDVHKRQVLKEKDPFIAYPGSLIQQNFSEEDTKGICRYSLDSGEKTFIPIQNDFRFLTLKIGESIEDAKKLGKILYLRLCIEDGTSPDDVEKYEKILRSSCKIAKLKYHYIETPKKSEGLEGGEEKKVLDKHEDDLIMIKRELKERAIEDKTISDEIIRTHSELKKEFSSTDFIYQDWKLLKLEFKNILIYGGDTVNTVDFSSGLILINGQNASGKSSILSIIKHVLFDFGNLSTFCNKKKKSYYVKAFLRIGAEDYTVLREGKLAKNIKKNKTEITITKGTSPVLSKSSRIGAYKYLKNLLGSKDDFSLTNIYNNQNDGSLLSMKNSERIESLNRLFKIEIYSDLESKAKMKLKEMDKNVNILKGEVNILTKDLEDFKELLGDKAIEGIEEEAKKFKKLEKDIITLKSKIDSSIPSYEGEVPKDLDKSKYAISVISNMMKDIADMRDRIIPLDKDVAEDLDHEKLKEMESKIDWNMKERDNLEAAIIGTELKLDELKYDESKIIDSEDVSLEDKRQILPVPNTYRKAKKDDLLQRAKKLSYEVHEYDGSKKEYSELCSKIGNILSKNKDKYVFSRESIEKLHRLLLFGEKVEDIEGKKSVLKGVEEVLGIIKHNSRAKYLINSYNFKESMKLKEKLKALRKEMDNLKMKNEYHKMKRVLSLKTMNRTIRRDMREMEKNLKDILIMRNRLLSDKVKGLMIEYEKKKDFIIKNDKINRALKKKNLYDEKSKELDKKAKERSVYKLYLSMVDKKCIPLKLLSEKIKGIENYTNDFLDGLVDYKCDMSFVDKKLDINCTKGDMIFDISQLSGYETFILNLAFKRALNRYSFVNRSRMVCIDEGWDCIDEKNFEKLKLLFSKLRRDYDIILVITHLGSMKTMIPKCISVKKMTEDYSIIE